MKRSLVTFALLAAVILLARSQTLAQQIVNPGQSVRFTQPTGGDGNRTSTTTASYAFIPPYKIRASAAVIGARNQTVRAQSYAYNDFKVSGSVPRVLPAQVTAHVDWEGMLGAVGVGGTKASVSILLTFKDLTSDVTVGQDEIHVKSIGGAVGSADLELDDSGSKQITINANVVRGHTYRLLFQIDCKASTGAILGSANSTFFPDPPLNVTGAEMTNLSLSIGGDVFELLDTIDNKINALQASVSAANTKLDTLQIGVNTANTRLTSVESKVDIANNTINTVNGKVDTINNKLDERLDVAVSTRASQTSVNALTGKVDVLAAALEAFQKLSLRAQIEAALVEGDRYNVAIYQVPESAGGYLELVRSIVADSIESCRKAGLNSFALGQAQGALASGDQYFAAKGYKDAYDQYRAAYLHLSIVPGSHRP